jgi:Tol biopolymer transport system component
MNPDGSGQIVLPLGDRHSVTPAWSPDATQIAFVTDEFSGARPEVWVMNADGSRQRRLTRKGGEPAWSPDGRSIAFSRDDDIYVMGSDGSGKRRLTRRGTSPTWSPDGRRIAFVRPLAAGCYRRNHDKPRCQNSHEIYVMNAQGTGQQRLTRNCFPEYEPDCRLRERRSHTPASTRSSSWTPTAATSGASRAGCRPTSRLGRRTRRESPSAARALTSTR